MLKRKSQEKGRKGKKIQEKRQNISHGGKRQEFLKIKNKIKKEGKIHKKKFFFKNVKKKDKKKGLVKKKRQQRNQKKRRERSGQMSSLEKNKEKG